MTFRPVIFGVKGLELSAQERAFFEQVRPFGFILFSRNIENKDQVKTLCAAMRAVTGRADTPILIDQEGGRVARLRPPHWRKCPPAKTFSDLCVANAETAARATYLNARLIAEELMEIGINVDCAPMLDILFPEAHEIVGDRAFGTTTEQIIALGKAMAEGLRDGGVMPIIKHIPGHGRAMVDSHESLPVVHAPHAELSTTDFVPFKALKEIPWAMTAHITYTAIDDQPATLSAKTIAVIREEIGFNGLLLTDDLSMKALTGNFEQRTRASLAAGCDIILHCNGDMAEMEPIAKGLSETSKETLARIARGSAWLNAKQKPDAQNANSLHSELTKLIGEAA